MSTYRRPLKSLGQNFLVDHNIIDKIVESARITSTDAVLEIGPGRGALTESLAGKAGKLLLIEFDHALAQAHRERYADDERVKVVDGDVLTVDLAELLKDGTAWKVVANLPYNISTPVLFRMLELREQLSGMVLMVQKEVGQRLTAQPGTGEYGVITVLLGLWFDISRLFPVAPGCFFPPPKVDSVVLRFIPRSAPRVVVDEELFSKVVKASFAMRRKTLANCIKTGFGLSADEAEAVFCASEISGMRRGETLNMDEFARLTRSIGTAKGR